MLGEETMATAGRDEMGKFRAHIQAKGEEAMKSIGGPEKEPKVSPKEEGKETLAEESAAHGVKLTAPLKAHKGAETPEEEAAEEKEIASKYGARPGKHKPWSMERSKGWGG